MEINPDFRDLLRALGACRVRYLVVGAYSVIYHTEPRFTKDIDIWVEPTAENAARTWRALAAFGAPLDGLRVADLRNPDLVYQIGVAPIRIDIMMGVPGVRFATAWRNRVRARYAGIAVNIIGRRDLMRAKRVAGRPQDLIDLAALRAERKGRAGRQRQA